MGRRRQTPEAMKSGSMMTSTDPKNHGRSGRPWPKREASGLTYDIESIMDGSSPVPDGVQGALRWAATTPCFTYDRDGVHDVVHLLCQGPHDQHHGRSPGVSGRPPGAPARLGAGKGLAPKACDIEPAWAVGLDSPPCGSSADHRHLRRRTMAPRCRWIAPGTLKAARFRRIWPQDPLASPTRLRAVVAHASATLPNNRAMGAEINEVSARIGQSACGLGLGHQGPPQQPLHPNARGLTRCPQNGPRGRQDVIATEVGATVQQLLARANAGDRRAPANRSAPTPATWVCAAFGDLIDDIGDRACTSPCRTSWPSSRWSGA